MIDTHWFHKKWGLNEPTVNDRIVELENRISKLEEDNIETNNILYELMNSLDAIDRRIDIVAENPWKEQFE